jgi:D-methionine transport system substrate-binding protein
MAAQRVSGRSEGRLTPIAWVVLAALAIVPIIGAAAPERIKVGVTAGPHAQILDVVVKVAAQHGLQIQPVEFTDYVIPNEALAQGEIDANAFQHRPYLANQTARTGWKLVAVGNEAAAQMGIFSTRYTSLEALPDGARIAIPNDPTNGSRALLLLAANHLVHLRDGVGLSASAVDIADNPRHLRIVELDAAQIARSLPDVDAAAVNSNYALQAGLDPVNGAIAKETLDSPYAVNVIAVREVDRDKPWVKELMAAYHSDEVRAFIDEKFKGAYIPAW